MTELRNSQRVSVQTSLSALCDWAETNAGSGGVHSEAANFVLELHDHRDGDGDRDGDRDARLVCVDVLRWLPQKRLVFSALLDDIKVVVKLFFGAGCERYALRERAGSEAIAQAGVATPNCLADWQLSFQDSRSTARSCALVFEYIDAQSLTTDSLERGVVEWTELARVLARLNAKGFTHQDFHLGNLLYQGSNPSRLWLVDGDGVRKSRHATTQRHAVAQFSRLCAQAQANLPAKTSATAWRAYCEQRGWSANQISSTIERSLRAARRRRVVHFQAKTRRNCSAVLRCRMGAAALLVNRDWLRETSDNMESSDFLDWLHGLPEEFEDYPVIKAGNTATLVTAAWKGRRLVIKRYNNKSLWHRARRLIRSDRGLNSWVFGHTLTFVGIPTATPVALRQAPLAGPTYLVMAALEGVELTPQACDDNEALFAQCAELLEALRMEGLVHGDLKASNFLLTDLFDTNGGNTPTDPGALQRLEAVRAAKNIALLDLDSMRMPRMPRSRYAGEIKDKRRFLRNFAAAPSAQRRFRSILGL